MDDERDEAFDLLLRTKLKEASAQRKLPAGVADRLATTLGTRERKPLGSDSAFVRRLAASVTLVLTLSVLSGVIWRWIRQTVPSALESCLLGLESEVSLPRTSDFTLEGWFRTGEGGLSENAVLGLAELNQSNRLFLEVHRGTAESDDELCLAVFSQRGKSTERRLGATHLKAAWHHFALVRHDESVSLYLDGRLEIASTGWLDGSPDERSFLIAPVLHGRLSEVRIWNEAKPREELIRKAARSLEGNEPGLVAYWPLSGPQPQSHEPFSVIGHITFWRLI